MSMDLKEPIKKGQLKNPAPKLYNFFTNLFHLSLSVAPFSGESCIWEDCFSSFRQYRQKSRAYLKLKINSLVFHRF